MSAKGNSDMEETNPIEGRRKSQVSKSFVEEEPSLEKSKKWIEEYMEGSDKEDDFQKKYFDNAGSPAEVPHLKVLEEKNKELETLSEPRKGSVHTPEDSPIKFFVQNENPTLSPENGSSLGKGQINENGVIKPHKIEKFDRKMSHDSPSKEEFMKEFNAPTIERKLSYHHPGEIEELDSENEGRDPLIPLKHKSSKTETSDPKTTQQTPDQTPSSDPNRKLSRLDLLLQKAAKAKVTIKVIDTSMAREQFYNLTEDEMRKKFICAVQRRLMPRRLGIPVSLAKSAQRSEQKIIIFDWDDTLFCTSFLSSLSYSKTGALGEKERLLFQKVDESAVSGAE